MEGDVDFTGNMPTAFISVSRVKGVRCPRGCLPRENRDPELRACRVPAKDRNQAQAQSLTSG